jgi:hypothetical protein
MLALPASVDARTGLFRRLWLIYEAPTEGYGRVEEPETARHGQREGIPMLY